MRYLEYTTSEKFDSREDFFEKAARSHLVPNSGEFDSFCEKKVAFQFRDRQVVGNDKFAIDVPMRVEASEEFLNFARCLAEFLPSDEMARNDRLHPDDSKSKCPAMWFRCDSHQILPREKVMPCVLGF